MPPATLIVTDRRSFLAALAALGGKLLLERRVPGSAAVRVEAMPTVFYAPPDGRSALVRFAVADVDSPGGRLRVFDQGRRLLGTAGMIGVAGALHGELWLPLERETEFVSELELPRVRGVLRSTHRVRPRRRWTLYTATAVDAGSLQAGARPGDPLVAGAGVAALRESGIGLNPLPREPAPEFLDHDGFLELGAAAADLEAQQGIPLSAIALDSTGLVGRLASAALMLAGSNIRCVAVREEPVSRALFRVESPDGSAVTVIALPAGGSPGDLGFPNGAGEMARRLERWLDAVIPLAGDDGAAVGLVLGTNADEGLRAVAAVTEWNSRFAYPKIVSGQLDELLARLQREPGTTTAGRRPLTPSDTPPTPPGRKGVDGNEGVRQRRVELVIAPLVSRLSTAASGLAAVAQQFSFRVPGTLVFNPTPFVRTDVAVMPDGTERIVTDVPPMGYACVPYPGYRLDAERLGRPGRDAGGRWQEIPGSGNEISIESQYFRVGLDPETGAIRSLVARASGREWVRPRSAGLNANAGVGFRLGQLVKHRNPGVGTRITAERRLSSGPGWRSTVTVYDQLPWVDISNEADPDATPLDALAFAFGLERPTVAWEIPAGHERSPAPVDRLVHLRWLTLTAGEDVVFFRGLETPATAVADDGSLRSLAPPRRARYRLAFASGFTAPDDPWRFGWGTEPLATAPVPGTGGATLPSFGSLVVVDQPGIIILELRPARNRDGVVIFLQELLGAARDITLGSALLTFRSARRIDFLERDLGALPSVGEHGAAMPIRGYGITAVRLQGVELAAR